MTSERKCQLWSSASIGPQNLSPAPGNSSSNVSVTSSLPGIDVSAVLCWSRNPSLTEVSASCNLWSISKWYILKNLITIVFNFSLWNNFKLKKNCKNRTKNSLVLFIWLFQMLTLCITSVHWSKPGNKHCGYSDTNCSIKCIPVSPSVLTNVLFLNLKSNPGSQVFVSRPP